MVNFIPYQGTITMIHDLRTGQSSKDEGCYKSMSIEDDTGAIANFIVAPATYVLNQVMLAVGDRVTAYYDGDAPAPLIFPPQYRTIVIVKDYPYLNVKVAHFNAELVSQDGQLKVNISPATPIVLTNGQAFMKNPAERNLIVVYGPATKSIPAQTEPYYMIVLC